MLNTLESIEYSFPIHIWDAILYDGLEEVDIDVYYNKDGFPKYIHDKFGANAVKDFRLNVIQELKNRNKVDKIWRMSSDAFAIYHKNDNCDSFTIEFMNLKYVYLKKTINIKVKKSK